LESLRDKRNLKISKRVHSVGPFLAHGYSTQPGGLLQQPDRFSHVDPFTQPRHDLTDQSARPPCVRRALGGGHHAPGASGVVVHGDSLVDNVWRRWRVKLNLEEGEAPSVVREVEAHCRGGATWGRGGAAAQQDFRAVVPRWYNSMRRRKGSLDSEQSTWEWSVNGAHRRRKLSDGGGSDSGVGAVL
jgi:hypothetical protein